MGAFAIKLVLNDCTVIMEPAGNLYIRVGFYGFWLGKAGDGLSGGEKIGEGAVEGLGKIFELGQGGVEDAGFPGGEDWFGDAGREGEFLEGLGRFQAFLAEIVGKCGLGACFGEMAAMALKLAQIGQFEGQPWFHHLNEALTDDGTGENVSVQTVDRDDFTALWMGFF